MPSLWCERSATLLLCGFGLALGNALWAQSVGKQGDEFGLNRARGGDQTCPNAAIGPAGGYVVWQDNAIDGPGKSFGIAGRKLTEALAPAGAIFRVNSTIKRPQENPQVALMMNGGAAFVWQGGRLGGQDIYFRTVSPEGVLAPTNDVRVNSYTAGQQSTPVITCLSNGQLAVAWCSLHEDKHLEGVYARIVSPAGASAKPPFRVNQFTSNNQRSPAITTLSNGNFVVVWLSKNQGVSAFEVLRHTNRVHVYARVFLKGGRPFGDEFRVNTRSNLCLSPSVAAWGTSGFTVTWAEKTRNRASSTFSVGDLVDLPSLASKLKQPADAVSTYLRDQLSSATLIALANYQGASSDPAPLQAALVEDLNTIIHGLLIYEAQLFAGVTLRPETQQLLAQNPEGERLLRLNRLLLEDAYPLEMSRANGWDICARTFSGSAQPASDAILVNNITYGDQFAPKIASVGSHQLVVWNSLGHDRSREGVFGRFLRAGEVDGEELLVNTLTRSSQIHPVVAGNRKDRFLVAWSGFMGPSSFDVRAQRYSATEPPPNGSTGGSGGGSGTGDPPPTGEYPPPGTGGGGGSGGSGSTALEVSLADTTKGKRLSWNTETGLVYQVQYSTNLSQWLNLGEPRPATATLDWVAVENGENAAFYRVIRLR